MEVSDPVSCHEGDVCAACFSTDGEWYLARIEKVISETVRNIEKSISAFSYSPHSPHRDSLEHCKR